LRKRDLRAPVKGDLDVTFSQERISAHGGLEIFRRYLQALEVPRRLREALMPHGLHSDYGVVGIAFSILALILIGGRRVTHLAFLCADPIVKRFAGLRQLPADRTVVRWLKRFSSQALLALETLIRDLVHDQIERAKLSSLTLDLDGTVLRTGAKVEGAARGFNPHHPKDPSYYPLTAHVASLGQILRVWNRPGNVNDAHNAAGFLRGILADLRERFGAKLRLSLRMDGAFFLPQVLQFLDEHPEVHWAMKVPLWKWLGLRQEIAQTHRWRRVDDRVEGFTTAVIFEWSSTASACSMRAARTSSSICSLPTMATSSTRRSRPAWTGTWRGCGTSWPAAGATRSRWASSSTSSPSTRFPPTTARRTPLGRCCACSRSTW
jgi:hypothetical protein